MVRASLSKSARDCSSLRVYASNAAMHLFKAMEENLQIVENIPEVGVEHVDPDLRVYRGNKSK